MDGFHRLNGGKRQPTPAIEARIFQRLFCGEIVQVIASIEDPVVIEKLLTHLNEKALPIEAPPLPKSRAPPQAGLFD